MAAAHLLAEAVRDEERVVDRDAEPDQGHDVQRVDGYVGDARDQVHPRDAADDREDSDTQGHERSDDRAEDDEQQHEREWQRDGLGPA